MSSQRRTKIHAKDWDGVKVETAPAHPMRRAGISAEKVCGVSHAHPWFFECQHFAINGSSTMLYEGTKKPRNECVEIEIESALLVWL
jgi:hypothetical protein